MLLDVTVTSLLHEFGLIVTEGLTWLQSTASAIEAEPLLLTFVGIGFVGAGIGLVRRIIG